jgi:hypothetical protein
MTMYDIKITKKLNLTVLASRSVTRTTSENEDE